ncbi:MAG: MFS transporter [Bacteroidetes bacterium]|nr:MFS transporter [Bacteroidota bacterium]
MSSLRRQRTGWYFYDWANSAFSTTVVTVFLGPYLASVAKHAAGADGNIHPFGFSIDPGSWFPFMVSFSVLLQVFVLPMVGAIADRSTNKRSILGVLAYGGAISTTLLFFLRVDTGNYLFGGFFFVLANVLFGASVVVYNSFLPELSSEADRDKVSSRGWAVGYLGGGLLLLMNLLYYKASNDGIDGLSSTEQLAIRTILASAGIWWATFTIIPLVALRSLRSQHFVEGHAGHEGGMGAAFKQLWRTLQHMLGYRQTLIFLCAYLLYNDAVQTVLTMASVYGQEELHLGLDTLTTAILMVQFVAIPGSILFERLASRIGTRNAIMTALVCWTLVLVITYAWVSTEAHFYILAALIAIVMGGTQALSRSYFSRMIPDGKEAEYFSLYEISDKGTSWIGPLAFGVALDLTHSYRTAILSLIVFFLAGMVLLVRVKRR